MQPGSLRLVCTLATVSLLAIGLAALLASPSSDLRPVRSAAFELDEPPPEPAPPPVR